MLDTISKSVVAKWVVNLPSLLPNLFRLSRFTETLSKIFIKKKSTDDKIIRLRLPEYFRRTEKKIYSHRQAKKIQSVI